MKFFKTLLLTTVIITGCSQSSNTDSLVAPNVTNLEVAPNVTNLEINPYNSALEIKAQDFSSEYDAINLYWDKSEHTDEPIDFRNMTSLKSTSSDIIKQVIIENLLPNTSYSIALKGIGINGQESSFSEVIKTSTSAAFDGFNTRTLQRLNDTGLTTCSTYTEYNLECPQSTVPDQDAEHGRDSLATTSSLSKLGFGNAGFDFTKIDKHGEILPDESKAWSCIRDNVTGNLWETKTNDESYRDVNNTFSWYDSNNSKPGVKNNGACTSVSCDTESYIAQFNQDMICGYDTWRLPKINDIISISDFNVNNKRLLLFTDDDYKKYWTSITFPSTNYDYAMIVSSSGSNLVDRESKATPNHIILMTEW